MLKLIFSILLLVGLIVEAESSKLDYYSDAKAKEKLDIEAKLNEIPNKSFRNEYYSHVDKLKTNKVFLMDLGSGLIIFSLCILLILFWSKINRIENLRGIKTFREKIFIFLSPIVWLCIIPGTIWYYSFRGARGDYPWFSDSIAIPIFYTTIAVFIGLVFLIIFLFIATRGSVYPAYLFIKPKHYNFTILTQEIFWGILLLINFICLVGFITDGDHFSIPINLFFTYLILILRAGQINRFNTKLDYSS